MRFNLVFLWVSLSFVGVGAIMLFLQPYIDFH